MCTDLLVLIHVHVQIQLHFVYVCAFADNFKHHKICCINSFCKLQHILTDGVSLHNYVLEKCIRYIPFHFLERKGGGGGQCLCTWVFYVNKFAFYTYPTDYHPSVIIFVHDRILIHIHVPIDSINVNDTCYLCYCYTCVYIGGSLLCGPGYRAKVERCTWKHLKKRRRH